MNKIQKVVIKKFWGDKTVEIDFDKDVNFLIGVNGSGKTTIINLIAATLCADFKTLDSTQFQSIEITFFNIKAKSKDFSASSIWVEKKERDFSPFPEIIFSLKNYDNKNVKTYNLEDMEEDNYYRYRNDYTIRGNLIKSKALSNDLVFELEKLVNVSWLTIHRMSNRKRTGNKNFESTIDEKIEDLQIDLVKYFSQLNRSYAIETEKFQKYIFESLLDTSSAKNLVTSSRVNSLKEKESLKSIFKYFKINEKNYSEKLDSFFEEYDKSYAKLTRIENEPTLDLRDFAYILGTVKIHSVIEEWNKINEKQKQINKTKETFLQVINSLLQRKSIFINERNELFVKTQSDKIFSLTNLSSGEKQLIIIFGQSLLQDEHTHIYIADEPELSLHIEWQETLVENLKSLNPNSQIIFATHSPDIVSIFEDKVLVVEKMIR